MLGFKSHSWFCTVVLFLLLSTESFADAMRCGNRLVSTGATKVEVVMRCGEPMFKETTKLLTKTRSITLNDGDQVSGNPPAKKSDKKSPRRDTSPQSKNNEGLSINQTQQEVVAVEQWTYNKGKGNFLRILTFVGGQLDTVEYGERAE